MRFAILGAVLAIGCGTPDEGVDAWSEDAFSSEVPSWMFDVPAMSEDASDERRAVTLEGGTLETIVGACDVTEAGAVSCPTVTTMTLADTSELPAGHYMIVGRDVAEDGWCPIRLGGACVDVARPVMPVRAADGTGLHPFVEASPGVYTSEVEVTFNVGPILSAEMDSSFGVATVYIETAVVPLDGEAGLTSGAMSAELTRYCEGVLDCAGVCDGDGFLNLCGDCEAPGAPSGWTDSFDAFDDALWDVLPTSPSHTYMDGALRISGDAGSSTLVPMRSQTTHDVQTISGSFNKNDLCSDHFVLLSPLADATFDWFSSVDTARFVWNCDTKYIYTEAGSSSEPCGGLGDYEIEIEVTPTQLIFRDDACADVTAPNPFGTSDLYVYVGADQDTPGVSSDWFEFEVNGGVCAQDCAGVWGGDSEEDMCGVCDDDPTNDCVQDCTGTWGGTFVETDCGDCYDPAVTAEPECFAEEYTLIMLDSFGDGWNGTTFTMTDVTGAVIADCGLPTGDYGECTFFAELDFSGCYTITVGGGTWDTEISWRLLAPDGSTLLEDGAPVELTLGDCIDCTGVAGGPAYEDMCGVCDDDPTNDCVEDCTGVWGGTFVSNPCGDCYDPATTTEPECFAEEYTVIMIDSYGDGWNGTTFTMTDSEGLLLADCGLPDGDYGECIFAAELDFSSCYYINVGGGTWDTEISWRLLAPDGFILLEDGAPVSLTLGDCVE